MPENSSVSGTSLKKIRLICIACVLILAAARTWHDRFDIDADGIIYIEKGEAMMRGDWDDAIDAQWAPLYPLILGVFLRIFDPSLYWEFVYIHILNYFIFLIVLFCFDLLLTNIFSYQKRSNKEDGYGYIPRPLLIVLFYSIFALSFTGIARMSIETPDTLMAGWLFLASILYIRILITPQKHLNYILLSVVLGLGYMTKPIMFYVSLLFFAMLLFVFIRNRIGFARLLISIFIFAIMSFPYIWKISEDIGRFTISEAGRNQYSIYVGHQDIYSAGEKNMKELMRHPPNRLLSEPIVINEYSVKNQETLPRVYNMAYWYEVKDLDIRLGDIVTSAYKGIRYYYEMFVYEHTALVLLFFTLLILAYKGLNTVYELSTMYFLLIPSMFCFAVYAFLQGGTFFSRYFGGINTLLWVSLFASIRLPAAVSNGVFLRSLFMVSSFLVILSIHPSLFLSAFVHNSPHIFYEVAKNIREHGIEDGEKTASLGYPLPQVWGRLARVKVTVEMYPDVCFWKEGVERRREIYEMLKGRGIKAIVAEYRPGYYLDKGWEHIGDTGYLIYPLN